jgi:putative NADPH-quinone reductase
MLDVSNEFDSFFRRYFCNMSDLDPFAKLFDGHQYMFIATWGGTKWSYSVETPHSEGP